jgi:hypothetical protein
MPDNSEVYDTMADAIEGAALSLFDNLDGSELDEMENDLSIVGIHYFSENAAVGADYVEISKMDPADEALWEKEGGYETGN